MMHVRSFIERDAEDSVKIIHDSTHGIGSLDYSADQVPAWSPMPGNPQEFICRVSDGRQLWVAVDLRERPLGFIELEKDGHIDCFSCRPQNDGSGVGSALYLAFEYSARALRIETLFVEASEVAKRFFTKNGFDLECRRDFIRDGVPILNYRMTIACSR